jgi:hypothetical protein
MSANSGLSTLVYRIRIFPNCTIDNNAASVDQSHKMRSRALRESRITGNSVVCAPCSLAGKCFSKANITVMACAHATQTRVGGVCE